MRAFLERGIESVSIDDITREAGVAKGSFYRYFADKDALVGAVIEASHDDAGIIWPDSIAPFKAAILNLRRNNVEVLEQQLRQTQERFNVGEITRTDVAQAEARLAEQFRILRLEPPTEGRMCLHALPAIDGQETAVVVARLEPPLRAARLEPPLAAARLESPVAAA